MEIRNVVAAIVKGLQPVLPSSVAIREADGQMIVMTHLGEDVILLGQNVECQLEDGASDHDALCQAALDMLNRLQDVVSVALTVPWPQEPGMVHSDFAEPFADIRRGTLYLRFGANWDAPAIPIVVVPLTLAGGSPGSERG